MDSVRRRVKGDGLAFLFDDDNLRYLARGEVACVGRLVGVDQDIADPDRNEIRSSFKRG
jgi:hypothetical protein